MHGPQTSVGSGLNAGPTRVAVDGAGDVFIADSVRNRVVEVPPAGLSQTTVGSGLVTLKCAGGYSGRRSGRCLRRRLPRTTGVVEVPVRWRCPSTVGSGVISPVGVALDAAGDVFIADSVANQAVEVQRSQPPSAYWVDIGSTAGGNNYYSSGNLGVLAPCSASTSNLPTNGSTVYVTLYRVQQRWSWSPNDYTYTRLTRERRQRY